MEHGAICGECLSIILRAESRFVDTKSDNDDLSNNHDLIIEVCSSDAGSTCVIERHFPIDVDQSRCDSYLRRPDDCERAGVEWA